MYIYIHIIQRFQSFLLRLKLQNLPDPRTRAPMQHTVHHQQHRHSPGKKADALRGRGGAQNRVKVPIKWLNKWGTPGNDRENAMEAAFWKQVLIFLGLVLYKTNTLESQCTRNGDIPLQMQTILLLLEPSPVLNAKSWFTSDNHAIMKPSKKWVMMVYLWRSTWKMMG